MPVDPGRADTAMTPFDWITAERVWRYVGVGIGLGLVGVGLVAVYVGVSAPEIFRFWLWLGVVNIGLGLMQLFYLVPRVNATLPQTADTNRNDE